MKANEEIDTTPIVVPQPYAHLNGSYSPQVIQTGEFRLINCHLNDESGRVEMTCNRDGTVLATVPGIFLNKLQSWIGKVVVADYKESDVPNEHPLTFLRVAPVKTAQLPFSTFRPKWIHFGTVPDFVQLKTLTNSLEDAYKALVNQCLKDDTIFEALLSHPASLGHHHNEPGGLLRHTVEVASDCAQACRAYASANFSLAVTAAILHDIGKCKEYAEDKHGGYSRSHTGELEMHKVQGAILIDSAGKACGVDPVLVSEVIHCITAAPGQDYMGLARPKMLEATLVQTADARSSAADIYRTGSKFGFSFKRFGGTYANREQVPLDDTPQQQYAATSAISAIPSRAMSPFAHLVAQKSGGNKC
jgi:putative nucleotidyltransferase with HDIG domain